jgi:hypothetical protein
MITAGARYGLRGLPFGELLFANRAWFSHYVCHSSLGSRVCCGLATFSMARLVPQSDLSCPGLLSCKIFAMETRSSYLPTANQFIELWTTHPFIWSSESHSGHRALWNIHRVSSPLLVKCFPLWWGEKYDVGSSADFLGPRPKRLLRVLQTKCI